jgi:hypothetical protein
MNAGGAGAPGTDLVPSSHHPPQRGSDLMPSSHHPPQPGTDLVPSSHHRPQHMGTCQYPVVGSDGMAAPHGGTS